MWTNKSLFVMLTVCVFRWLKIFFEWWFEINNWLAMWCLSRFWVVSVWTLKWQTVRSTTNEQSNHEIWMHSYVHFVFFFSIHWFGFNFHTNFRTNTVITSDRLSVPTWNFDYVNRTPTFIINSSLFAMYCDWQNKKIKEKKLILKFQKYIHILSNIFELTS